jgi:type I restriction enzyme R subunit
MTAGRTVLSIASSANEATTRSQVIDTQLAQAGWSKSRRSLVEEFVVMAKEPDRSFDGQQFADYVLLGSDGKPLAVVEAKRTARDELAGKRQAADYADAIKSKFTAAFDPVSSSGRRTV